MIAILISLFGDIVGWAVIIWGLLSFITAGWAFILPIYPSYFLTKRIGEKASRKIFKASLWCLLLTFISMCVICWCYCEGHLPYDSISTWDIVAPFTTNALFSIFYYFGKKGAIEDMAAEEDAKMTGEKPKYKTIGQITNPDK